MITFDKIGNLGRLANQMFQYSLLYSVAKRNNFEFVLPKENLKNIVDSGFNPVINKKESMYLYLPECFNITGKFLPKSEIHSKYFYDHGRDYAKYSPEVFNISDNTNIKGYFQSYKYFDNIKDDIKKEFAEYIKNPSSLDLSKNSFTDQISNISSDKILALYREMGSAIVGNVSIGPGEILFSIFFSNVKKRDSKGDLDVGGKNVELKASTRGAGAVIAKGYNRGDWSTTKRKGRFDEFV